MGQFDWQFISYSNKCSEEFLQRGFHIITCLKFTYLVQGSAFRIQSNYAFGLFYYPNFRSLLTSKVFKCFRVFLLQKMLNFIICAHLVLLRLLDPHLLA
jgi:hypothetical protein